MPAGRPLGFVLAGGQSRRMGRDKALLPWGAGTLLDHALRRLAAVSDEVLVLSGRAGRYPGAGCPELPDAWPDAGPLGGLLAGLERLGKRPGLFLAVDVPLVPEALLAHLASLLPGWDAVVPVLADGPQPLVAAYSGTCAEAVRSRLGRAERRMTCFWPDVRVRELHEPDLQAFGPDVARLFANANAPAQFAELGSAKPPTES